MASSGGSSGGSCGACKFLRRKCERGCMYAPYFSPEEGVTDFAAIHKVFGASNMGKFLRRVPVGDRRDVARTITYEAHARLSDPVFGCVRQICVLQQQVTNLEEQLMQAKALLLAHTTSTVNDQLPPASQPQEQESIAADPSLHSSPSYNKQTMSPSLDHTDDQNVLPCQERISSIETEESKLTLAAAEYNDLDKWIEHFFVHYRDDLFLDF